MNVSQNMADRIVSEAGKSYVLTIDPETGEERKVELKPINEFSQEAELDYPDTIH